MLPASCSAEIAAAAKLLLEDPAAWQPPLQKARQPFDFMVAALRGLGIDGATVLRMGNKPFRRMVREPMQLMGQDWESPRGPVKIDPETRHITQTIYLREVAKDAQGRWINKEIASVPEQKDSGLTK